MLAVKNKPFERVLSNYLGMTRTFLFNCPIKAEIRTVDSQSDLRICYSYDYNNNNNDDDEEDNNNKDNDWDQCSLEFSKRHLGD